MSYVLYIILVTLEPANGIMVLQGPMYDSRKECERVGEIYTLKSELPIKSWGAICEPVPGKRVQKNPAQGGAIEVTKEN